MTWEYKLGLNIMRSIQETKLVHIATFMVILWLTFVSVEALRLLRLVLVSLVLEFWLVA